MCLWYCNIRIWYRQVRHCNIFTEEIPTSTAPNLGPPFAGMTHSGETVDLPDHLVGGGIGEWSGATAKWTAWRREQGGVTSCTKTGPLDVVYTLETIKTDAVETRFIMNKSSSFGIIKLLTTNGTSPPLFVLSPSHDMDHHLVARTIH